MNETNNEITEFLKANGFRDVRGYGIPSYTNDKCVVNIAKDHTRILSHEQLVGYGLEGHRYFEGHSITQLIGILTYYRLIDRNYIGGVSVLSQT